MSNQKGFTLIELMVAVFIIGILAAIAVPSYRQYTIKNAESQVQSHMGSLQLELERWRASALTYRGFTPRKSDGTFGYDNSNTDIFAPLGSTAANAKYTITLVGGGGGSLVTGNGLQNARNATTWVMLATPTTNAQGASRILMTSTGQRCKSTSNDFCKEKIQSCTCTTSEQSW